MEQYYFIEKNGSKLGPYKFSELKQQPIYFNELIWRSDSDQWKRASDFEELKDIFIIKPPLTPIEANKKDSNNQFLKSILPIIIVIYILASFFLSIISYTIANNGWQAQKNNYIINNDQVGKSVEDEKSKEVKANQEKIISDGNELLLLRQQYSQIKQKFDNRTSNKAENGTYYMLGNKISRLELDSSVRSINNENELSGYYDYVRKQTGEATSGEIEPIYNIPNNVKGLENINALQQSFLIRAYYAYFSKIYLTSLEQDNSGLLFLNIALSAFVSLSFFFIAFGIIYYAIKRNNLSDKRAKMENIN